MQDNQMQHDQMQHEKWSSTGTFLLASIGAAVGLGNLWRFPFMVGENGGAAFVAVYICFILLLAVPIIAAELLIGRRGKSSPVNTMRELARRENLSPKWQFVGWLSLAVPLLGLSFYSIVAGWSIDYVIKAALGVFQGMDTAGSEHEFAELLASPTRLLVMHSLFISVTVLVVGRGLHRGIELIARYMMPLLFIILALLVINSIVSADIKAGLNFLFAPDFSKLSPQVVFLALGQAFFSVAIGVGMLMTYGAYLPEQVSLPKSAAFIAVADTFVALLAGIAIFPLVFTYGLNPGEGPGLIFVTLPVAFGQMPAGWVLGLVFFILLFAAAFTTAIGMLEPIVSFLEERKGTSRPLMAALAGAFAWILGIGAALSFNLWEDFTPFDFIPLLESKGVFDLLDFLVSNIMLPLNGLLIAVFAGWFISRDASLEELGMTDGVLYSCWRFILRYVAPTAILLIFYTTLV